MFYSSRFITFFLVATSLLATLFFTFESAHASEGAKDLAVTIANLELGIDGYTIGSKLTAEKKKFSSTRKLDDAYEGTYKFSDGDLFVVVAEQNDTVLALYKRNEEAGLEQVKQMVSGLMEFYGDPTAMAHDKLIYWAYNNKGKIGEDNYNKAREKGKPLDVLATVKFSSAFEITQVEKEAEPKGTIYFIISSDRLTKEFMRMEQ